MPEFPEFYEQENSGVKRSCGEGSAATSYPSPSVA
jgi:hypothetical protein